MKKLRKDQVTEAWVVTLNKEGARPFKVEQDSTTGKKFRVVTLHEDTEVIMDLWHLAGDKWSAGAKILRGKKPATLKTGSLPSAQAALNYLALELVAALKRTTKKATKKSAKKSAKAPLQRKEEQRITVLRKPVRQIQSPQERAKELLQYMGPKKLAQELAAMRKTIIAQAKHRRAALVLRTKQHLAALKQEREAFLLKLATRLDEVKLEHARELEQIRSGSLRGKQYVIALRKALRAHRLELAEHKRKIKKGSGGALARSEMLQRTRQEVEATHPDLLPYFETVKMRLRNRPKLSAFEQFLQMVHDNPDAAMRSSIVASDRKVADLLRQGDQRWETRAARLEGRICQRAHKLANKGLPFRLKDSEARLLSKAGYDVEELEMRCHRPTRRIVSKRGQIKPERAPF